jgi:HAD superfamily hydrolase (TIGR01509 family)
MIELIAFDADGVLFNSDRSNVAYYNAIFARVGEPALSPSEESAAISYAAAEMFKRRAQGNEDLLMRMLATARGIDNAEFFSMLTPALDLRPFMAALKLRYRIALATNRSATVPALVNHLELDGMFDAIASALDGVRPKPAPDILELCIRRAGAEPSRSLYVGDSPIDLDAARAAGMHFVGVGARVEHDRRIDTIAELPGYLSRLERELG